MNESLFEIPDDELLARCVGGDERAFEELIGRHDDSVRRLAGGLLAWSGDVPDAVQDVWLAVWNRRKAFRGESAVATWIKGIVINVCRNRRRSRWFRRRVCDVPESSEQPSDPLESVERHHAVRSALGGISASVREVTVLYYLEEMSSLEIAEQLGLAVNTVDKRLQRGRDQLRRLLDRVRNPA